VLAHRSVLARIEELFFLATGEEAARLSAAAELVRTWVARG
jgi:hypothetical protein